MQGELWGNSSGPSRGEWRYFYWLAFVSELEVQRLLANAILSRMMIRLRRSLVLPLFILCRLAVNSTLKATVKTGGEGISGGFFGENRLQMLNEGKSQCVYAAEASSGSVVGINVATLKIGGAATGSSGDTGFSNGMGLAMNPQYLYASFSDSNTIGTFQVKPGCKLTFIGDLLVGGLLGGTINAMAIHGELMVATYTDGSIESFDVSAGTPVSNGDEQKSTGSRGGSTYPGGIDISQDGHFRNLRRHFENTTVVEVSDIFFRKIDTNHRLPSGSGPQFEQRHAEPG